MKVTGEGFTLELTRFSKSGNPEVEKWYATHFIDSKRIAELKTQQQSNIDQAQ